MFSGIPIDPIQEEYVKQMAERHAFLIDKNFWLVVKEKPRWLPQFIYKAVIKELVEFNETRTYTENFIIKEK